MQMLKKIFKSDKKFYLELPDEIEEAKPVQTVVKTAEKVKDVVQDKAQDLLDSQPAEEAAKATKQAKKEVQDKAQEAVKKADQAKEEVQDKLESATKEAKPQKKAKASAKKQNSKKPDSEKSQTKTKSSPQNAGASSFEPPFWVAAMYNNSGTNGNSNGTQAGQTFATENLMPIATKYRRRPGPSLSKFRDMAKSAKTPKG